MHSNTFHGFHEHTRDDDLSNRSLVAVNEATTTTKSGRNKMRLVATFVLMSFGILYWISVAGDAQDISYVLVLQQQQPEPQSSRRKDNNAVLSAPHNDRQLETLSVTSAPTTAARYTPALRYIQHLNTSCIMRLQHAVSKWMSCVDGSVSAAAGSSRWSKHNPCGFIDIPSFHDPLVTGLMMSHVLEAHGDSTLRELLKLMIGGLKMEGTLDKKDASAALRAPKYFMRWLGRPNETQHVNAFRDVRERKRSTGGSLLHRHRCFGEIVESALTLIHATTSSGLVVDDSGGAPPLLPYRHNFGGAAAASSIASPLALRFMFRFDFVPVSFFEQLNGTIPLLQPPANSTESTSVECQELAAAGGSVTMHKPTSFFDGDAAQRIILLATGSHTAKIIASNQSAQVYSRRLVTEPAFAVDELFRLVIMDTEDYIIRRLLGLIVVRNPTTREPVSLQRLLPASMKSSSTVNIDAAVAPADAIIIFEEDLECESMNEAKQQGFRDMALHCPLMRTLLQRINELLRIHIHFTFSSLTSGDVGAMHRHSALKQLLTKDQRLTVGQRVIYVPLLDCHGGGKFQYTPSKPYCTRDGIHLRTKFIRKKVSVLLNVLLGLAKCSA
ncbi:GPI-anchored surface protein, putative [Bodo saltans]|uniref:GPI-anchored surface protein, putative n=1 Tax=Bodo saltans TaxID=75058 RepID=A0A0S4IXW9_BODSA|nr:GPI-anchored surface protein, putative [Bodo saltans]|eukprot:CUG06498.1 GPI-anchored surface protein, putative [Bodo saltans]